MDAAGSTSAIPRIYTLAEAAELLRVSQDYLRARCRDRTFAAMKLANRWSMTEQQLLAAIEASSTTVRSAPETRFRRTRTLA